MKIEINIGLVTSETTGKQIVPLSLAKSALESHSFQILRSDIVQSETEPTLVALVEYGNAVATLIHSLECLALSLSQDCVAALLSSNGASVGILAGPRAADWGPFNPEYFIRANG